MKSAMGPTRSREIVLAREIILTCVDVAESIDRTSRTSIPEEDEDEGKDSTMVPIFDITISH
jgi:hypothetical protein